MSVFFFFLRKENPVFEFNLISLICIQIYFELTIALLDCIMKKRIQGTIMRIDDFHNAVSVIFGKLYIIENKLIK